MQLWRCPASHAKLISMIAAPPSPPELTRLLESIRDARFASGARCPRCGHDRTHRWGSFSGRQRYRCTACRRTFSDLTGTPAAYSKKLLLWADYSQCIAEGTSVRRAARRLRIHPCTAFRWRHALLDALRERDDEALAGWIELGSVAFPYSEKGRRGATDPRRRGPIPSIVRPHPVARVLVACDRRARTITALAGVATTSRLHSHEIERILAARVGARSALVSADGPYAPARIAARRMRWMFVDARRRISRPRSLGHVRTVQAYVHRLRDWLDRFHGVATRYLPNYLAWHRAVDARWTRRVQAEALRWPVGAAPG